MSWSTWERRWLNALFAATLGRPEAIHPEFWGRFIESAPLELRWGLRVSTWVLTFLALICHARPFHWLPFPLACALVERWNESKSYVLRQMVMTIKVVVCFEYLGRDAIRRELGA